MESKDLFNIKETVNRNIEKHQTPNFGEHRSLVGWCSMNYPKVLTNPLYLPRPTPKTYDYDLTRLYQAPLRPESDLAEPPSHKPTSLTLTTTPHPVKAQIFQLANQKVLQFSNVKPLSCLLGPNKDGKFERRIRQIGEITYTPPEESEQLRHLKRLPNSVLTEQNLMEVLSPELEELNLQSNYWVTNDLLNKIGYFATNIQVLDISFTCFNDDTLVELGKSCSKLRSINISNSKALTNRGLRRFLQYSEQLERLQCDHNDVDDTGLEPLSQLSKLKAVSLSFTKVSSKIVDSLVERPLQFVELQFSSCPLVKAEGVIKLIDKSYPVLEVVNLSFNARDDFNNALMLKIGCCPNLRVLEMTGCSYITDEGLYNLINGERKQGKLTKPEGFRKLQIVKLGGLPHLSDAVSNLFKCAHQIEHLEVNGLQKLTDGFLENAKQQNKLRTVLLNYTPNITDAKLEELRLSHPHIRFVRHILKPTDPKDDGLRMPYPPANLKKKKPKGKKK